MDGHHPLTDEVSDATHSLLDFFSAPTPNAHDEKFKKQQQRKQAKNAAASAPVSERQHHSTHQVMVSMYRQTSPHPK